MFFRRGFVKCLNSHFYALFDNFRSSFFELVKQFAGVVDKLRVLGDRLFLEFNQLVLSHLKF